MRLTLDVARPLAWLAALAVAAPARAEAPAVAFAVDSAMSHVRIHLGRTGMMKFLGHEHHIEAPIAAGHVVVVDDDPARSSVALRFEAAKLRIVPGSEPAGDIPTVEARMRGPEVLEVARYPEVTFASTSVRTAARDGSRFRLVVAGTLTLRGRSFPVEVPLELTREGDAIEAHGELELKLRGVGIEPPSVAGVVKVADPFRLEFQVRAGAAAAQP
jgi:polyisoprenoid-binding protein YceI